jgi:hypothetical protein
MRFRKPEVRKPTYLFWDTVRGREESLHQRARSLPGAPPHASSPLLYWDLGVDTGVDGLDTVAYSGRRINRRILPEYAAMLALFSSHDLRVERTGKTLLYYMDLRKDDEDLIVFTIEEKVTKEMLTVPGVLSTHIVASSDFNSRRKAGPTEVDEHVVLAELVRGQSDVFARDY